MSEHTERRILRENLISHEFEFEELAFRIFHYQYHYNGLFREFSDHLGRNPGNVSRMDQFPFLPIRFFRTHKIATGSYNPEAVFRSSGTTNDSRSEHYIRDLSIYKNTSAHLFETIYGNLKDYTLLALLPSYLEQRDSSLIYMVEMFMNLSSSPDNKFYRYNFDELNKDLNTLEYASRTILLWGVTYALLDFSEQRSQHLEGHVVMETGGMKGFRQEMIRSEIHDVLKEKLGISSVHSEYGMTEMLSQCYAPSDGLFRMNGSVRTIPFDITDPLTALADGQTGRCHIIDLANLDSCSFIASDDLCRTSGDTFEVLGRIDYSDVRGCNLLYR